MKAFRIIITLIAYTIIALFEVYWYSEWKSVDVGIFCLFTLFAFIATFIYTLIKS